MSHTITLFSKVETVKDVRHVTQENGATVGLKEALDFVDLRMSESRAAGNVGIAVIDGNDWITETLYGRILSDAKEAFRTPAEKVFAAFLRAFETHVPSCWNTERNARCRFASDVLDTLTGQNITIPDSMRNRLLAINWDGE